MNIARSVATVGQLRQAIANIPDDTRLLICAAVTTPDGMDTVTDPIARIEHHNAGQPNTTSYAERVVIYT